MRIINYFLALTVTMLITGCPIERPLYYINGTSKKKNIILENMCRNTYSYAVNIITPKEVLEIDKSINDLFSENEYTILPGERKIHTRLMLSKKIEKNYSGHVKYTFTVSKNGDKLMEYTDIHLSALHYEDDFIRIDNTEYKVITFCGGSNYNLKRHLSSGAL